MVIGDVIIRRGDIKEIILEWATVVYDYYRFKRYGQPYQTGWRDWPQIVLWKLDALAEAEAEYQKNRRAGWQRK